MTKIGFIDYYLDEWHGNNYKEFLNNAYKDEFSFVGAYGKIDSPLKGGKTSKEWSEEQNIPIFKTIEEVVSKSDALIVLSPDNPEYHVELSKIPLESGKPTFVDKTFALDVKSAETMFEIAKKNNTPMYSASAFRFSEEFEKINKENIYKISSYGVGEFERYLIHQVDPICSFIKEEPKRVMAIDKESYPTFIIEFKDGRMAETTQVEAKFSEFDFIYKDRVKKSLSIESDIWIPTIKVLGNFLKTGKVPVTEKETINTIKIVEGALKAIKNPFTFINL